MSPWKVGEVVNAWLAKVLAAVERDPQIDATRAVAARARSEGVRRCGRAPTRGDPA